VIRRILVAVDFRQPSLAAARWVATHLSAADEIELAHVVRRTELPPFLQGLSLPPVGRDPGLESVDRALQGLAGTLHWRRISVATLAGHPVHALAARALTSGADLLVLGRDVLDGSRGRTLERLVRRLPIPVLAVGPAVRERPTQVIASVDAAPLRTGVVRCAGLLARLLGSDLTLLHALPGGLDRQVHLLARAWLEGLRCEMPAGSSVSAHTKVVQGAAGPSLRAEAGSKATLVVVGRNGSDAEGRRDLGSTTRLILSEARGPVLVVPTAGAWLPSRRLTDPLRGPAVAPQPATVA
jgi:nucleotide-binding universal stress UspA family protein